MADWPSRMPEPQYMPCPDCGASVRRSDGHECDPEKKLDYEMVQMRGEIDGVESEIAAYLKTAEGRFESYYLRRQAKTRGLESKGAADGRE